MVWLRNDFKKMNARLIVLIPFLTPSVGGGAFVFFNILKRLSEHFDVHVVYFQERAKDFIPSGMPSYILEKQTGNVRHYLQYPRIIIQAARLLDKIKPDIIITNLYQPFWIFLLARMLSRSKAGIITGEHNNLTAAFKDARFGGLRQFLVSKLDPLADLIIVPSEGIYHHLIDDFQIPAEKITVVHNPVVTEDMTQMSREPVSHDWLTNRQVPVILSVGALNQQKDPVTLLRAFSIVRSNIRARCMFLGDGPMHAELISLAKELNMADDVALPGFINNPFNFMAKADVFVLSSVFEGFGNVIVESMACGCPVISTRCPYGPEEIITDGVNGLLVKAGDASGLADNIIRVLTDNTLKQSLIDNGHKRAMDFTAVKSADEYIEAIKRCLQN